MGTFLTPTSSLYLIHSRMGTFRVSFKLNQSHTLEWVYSMSQINLDCYQCLMYIYIHAHPIYTAGVILVPLNLTCTVKDSCEPKCHFLSFKVHRVSFFDNFVQNYRKNWQILSIFETFMQPNNRFCCLYVLFQPNWNIIRGVKNRVKFGEIVVVMGLGQVPSPIIIKGSNWQ